MLIKSSAQILHITVKIKSFSTVYLNRFLILAFDTIRSVFQTLSSVLYLPKKIEKITLLKSPHIYKKAREQFERITYNRVFSIAVFDSHENQKILYHLLTLIGNFSQGVSVQFTYKIVQKILLLTKNKKL
jgi:small subunit ribosomal protein S10